MELCQWGRSWHPVVTWSPATLEETQAPLRASPMQSSHAPALSSLVKVLGACWVSAWRTAHDRGKDRALARFAPCVRALFPIDMGWPAPKRKAQKSRYKTCEAMSSL